MSGSDIVQTALPVATAMPVLSGEVDCCEKLNLSNRVAAIEARLGSRGLNRVPPQLRSAAGLPTSGGGGGGGGGSKSAAQYEREHREHDERMREDMARDFEANRGWNWIAGRGGKRRRSRHKRRKSRRKRRKSRRKRTKSRR